MNIQNPHGEKTFEFFTGHRKSVVWGRSLRRRPTRSERHQPPGSSNVRFYRWAGLLLLLLSIAITPGCYNRQSNAPPNPIIPQSQPGISAPPSSPAPATPSAPRPMYHDFPDIPVPVELTRLDKDTFVFQSGALKAGLLTLRGTRVDLSSLISFFQMAMPRENWKPKGGFHSDRTVLIFEKPEKTCVINLYEKMFRTYVEIYVAPASGQPMSGLPFSGPQAEATELPANGPIRTS